MEKTLNLRFGIPCFRPGQREAIEAVLAGRDVFVCMATGAGKSLCYQFPPVYVECRVAVVVSPLISLMEDQVSRLRARGISACYASSTLPYPELLSIQERVGHGDFRVVFLAPERLEAWLPTFVQLAAAGQLQLLAVDEAHCVSEWGHNFRPEYKTIGVVFRSALPAVPIVALTATATERVRNEIVANLRMRDPLMVVTSFNRPNITYKVVEKSGDCAEDLAFIINDSSNSAIIYTPTIKETELIAGTLAAHGVSCRKYSSVLGKDARSEAYTSFVEDTVQVVVATVAFGMGVDKPNVRFIINYGLPKSLEAYYQQSGRGGRDGNPAVSIIFWSPGDMKRECFLANFTGPAELRARARVDYQLVSDYVADTVSCRRKLLLSYFGEKFDKSHATTNDECCDNCVHRQHVRKDLTPQAQVLISAITSVYLPIRKFVVEAALKTAKAKQWGYTVAWWRELLLLLRVEGYLEYVLDSERLRVTQKGTLAMSTRSPITVPATNAISAELCETGKVVLPSLSPKNRTGTVARPPLKRVLPTTFKAKVMLPCKKQPSHIERISQARLESGSSRYTGSGFTFMSLLK